MGSRLIWLVALWAVLGCSRGLVQPSNNGESCHPDKLTVYRMVLHTFWTREKFPKHYPDWRPTAQWSKLYGLSHDSSYILFRLGQRVSAGVRAFAESGRADALEAAHGALDTFAAPALAQGIGRSEAEFFVDGNHSRVSVMSRMVPSPDWFIGIDSFDLCVDGNWLDSITIEVDPIDAGTDNGFTFTAPNWPTAPQGVAYRITSRYPSHPAGSFFYPHLRRLPPIATFQFIKLREYEVSEVFSHESDERRYEVVRLERLAHNSIDVLDGNAALAAADERERAEQVAPTAAVGSTASGITWSWPANVSRASTAEPRSANEVAAGDTRAIMRGLARRYRRRQIPAERRARRKKTKSPADCRVSPWGAWSACSCGAAHVGESRRERRVMRRARGGRSCPPLRQTRWCAACQADNYTVERGNNQW